LSPTRPLFIDNRDGNTLDRAIADHLRTLRREMALPWEVCIATAFFNVPASTCWPTNWNRLRMSGCCWGRAAAGGGRAPTPPGDPTEPEFTGDRSRRR
jgi:hypothetical protein